MLKEKFLFLFKQKLSTGSKVVKLPHQKHSRYVMFIVDSLTNLLLVLLLYIITHPHFKILSRKYE